MSFTCSHYFICPLYCLVDSLLAARFLLETTEALIILQNEIIFNAPFLVINKVIYCKK